MHRTWRHVRLTSAQLGWLMQVQRSVNDNKINIKSKTLFYMNRYIKNYNYRVQIGTFLIL